MPVPYSRYYVSPIRAIRVTKRVFYSLKPLYLRRQASSSHSANNWLACSYFANYNDPNCR